MPVRSASGSRDSRSTYAGKGKARRATTSSGNFFSMMTSSSTEYRTFFTLTAAITARRNMNASNGKSGSVFSSQWYPIRLAQTRASSRMVVVRGPLMVFLPGICAKIASRFSKKNAVEVDTLCCRKALPSQLGRPFCRQCMCQYSGSPLHSGFARCLRRSRWHLIPSRFSASGKFPESSGSFARAPHFLHL